MALAPDPHLEASRTMTDRCGSRSLSAMAVQRPVNPPPTTATSHRCSPFSGGQGLPVCSASRYHHDRLPACGAGGESVVGFNGWFRSFDLEVGGLDDGRVLLDLGF